MSSEITFKKYSGSMLKNLRLEKGLTQQALAQALSNRKKEQHDDMIVTRQTISKYENGERGMNLEMIFDLSAILGVPVNYFFPSTDVFEETILNQTPNMFSKTIVDDEGFSLEIKTPIPFDQLDREEQKEIMDSAMEELIKLKKEIRDSSLK